MGVFDCERRDKIIYDSLLVQTDKAIVNIDDERLIKFLEDIDNKNLRNLSTCTLCELFGNDHEEVLYFLIQFGILTKKK